MSTPPPPLSSGPPGDSGVPGAGGGGQGRDAQSRRGRAEGRAGCGTGGQRCSRFAGQGPVASGRGGAKGKERPLLVTPHAGYSGSRPEEWVGCGASAPGSALLGGLRRQ